MPRSATLAAALLGVLTPVIVQAQTPFQLVVTVSPPGSQTNPANWQPVKRFAFNGTPLETPASFPDLPTTQVFDPAGVAFRTSNDLFVGNRHGNALGLGSISRFTLSPTGGTATYQGNFTTPGMIGVHELAFSPTTGELFAAAVGDGVYRFTFDASGQPAAHGHFAAGQETRGVLVHPGGQFVYTTVHTNEIRTWALGTGGAVTYVGPTIVPGASNLHFFAQSPHGSELYVCDIDASRVYRYQMLPGGGLVFKSSISSLHAIDLAFSSDGNEMFVGNHYDGGITRFTYNAAADTWTEAPGGFIATPSMGGFATYVRPPCGAADIGKQGGLRGADGHLDNNDFVVFIDLFFAHDARADFGAQGGIVGSDGLYDNNDFVVFIDEFFFGCV
jgi:hypothetical protein